MKQALLLIDIQKQSQDVWHKDHINQHFVNNVLKTISWADKQQVPVIHILTEYEEDNLPALNSQKGYRFFMKGSEEAQEIDEIAASYKDNHYKVIKEHYDSFWQTNLDDLLKKLDVDTLIITGVYTHWCVLSTVFSALSRNYNITIVTDAVGSRYPELDLQLFKNVFDKKTAALQITKAADLAVTTN